MAGHLLSTQLDDPEVVPYFLWDDAMTLAELRRALAQSSGQDRDRLLARILREAREPDVWLFTTPREVAEGWERLAPFLGRRRSFWTYLLGQWRKEGLLAD